MQPLPASITLAAASTAWQGFPLCTLCQKNRKRKAKSADFLPLLSTAGLPTCAAHQPLQAIGIQPQHCCCSREAPAHFPPPGQASSMSANRSSVWNSSVAHFDLPPIAQTLLYPSSYCPFTWRLSHPPENPAGCCGHCTWARAAQLQSTEQEDQLQGEFLGSPLQPSLPAQHPGATCCMGGGGSRSTAAVQAIQAALPACPRLSGLTHFLLFPPN